MIGQHKMGDSYEQAEFNAERAYHGLDKRMSLLEQKLDTIANNHLAHIADDIKWLKTVVYFASVALAGNLLSIIYMLWQQ